MNVTKFTTYTETIMKRETIDSFKHIFNTKLVPWITYNIDICGIIQASPTRLNFSFAHCNYKMNLVKEMLKTSIKNSTR